MNELNLSLAQIRKIIYEGEVKRFPYILDWKSNPYTCFKARYYIEGSIVLTYILLKTNIKANTITLVYCLAGIIGGILLAIPDRLAILAAVIIFFNKGIIDWTDGYVARLKYGPTLTGHILDCYGARLNSLGFAIGLGLYVYNRNGYEWLVFTLPLVPFFQAALLTSFAKNLILDKIIASSIEELNEDGRDKNTSESEDIGADEKQLARSLSPRVFHFFTGFMDDRARSVDFVLMIIVLEMFNESNLSLLLFLALVFRWFVVAAGSCYVGIRGGWAESVFTAAVTRVNR